jgi:hypothetical protein
VGRYPGSCVVADKPRQTMRSVRSRGSALRSVDPPSTQSRTTRLRIRGVSSASAFSRISGMATRSLAGLFAKVMPRSSRKARSWLITAVRQAIIRSHTHVNCLQVQLVVCLDRDKTHVLAINGFGNRFSVQIVVLVRLQKGPSQTERQSIEHRGPGSQRPSSENALPSRLPARSRLSPC